MHKPWRTKLGNFTVVAPNPEEYHSLKREIFSQDNYYVEVASATPRILDIGAHIGLATLYFKKLFPLAVIDCYEANPGVIQFLEENIFVNSLRDVTVHQLAVSSGSLTFDVHRDTSPDLWWSTASSLPGGWTGTQTTKKLTVPAVPLRDILRQRFDIVKIDVEGAEQEILHSAADVLRNADQFILEFHPVVGQKLEDVQELFTDACFQVELVKNGQKQAAKIVGGLVVLHAMKKS
jgi:FkbM family methyltransferase